MELENQSGARWRTASVMSVVLFALGIIAERCGRGAAGWYGMAGFFLLAAAIQVSARHNQTVKESNAISFPKIAVVALAFMGLASLIMSVVRWSA